MTDRLTIHPVCMTTHKVTPPCLPYDPHHHAAIKEQEDDLKKLEIEAQAASIIKPTAVIELESVVGCLICISIVFVVIFACNLFYAGLNEM